MPIFHPQLEYQPERFDDIHGQPFIKILTTKLQKQQISPLYLITGPNGTGKTLTAKILTRAILCENLQGYNPCGQCPSCQLLHDLPEHRHPDVIWTSGPSIQKGSGFEDIKEQLYYPPTRSYRIIVIDEAAVIPPAVRNALLVLTEDPSVRRLGNVFILMTMQPEALGREMYGALAGRSLHVKFGYIPITSIATILNTVLKELGIDNNREEAAQILALASNGSVRQALQLLDAAYCLDTNLSAQALMIVTQLIPKLNRHHIWTLLSLGEFKALRLFLENECSGALTCPEQFYKSLLLDIETALVKKALPMDSLTAINVLIKASQSANIDPVHVVYQLQPYASAIRNALSVH